MSTLLRVYLLIGAATVLVAVVLLIRRNFLQVKYALMWLGASFVLVGWACFPAAAQAVARLLGVEVTSNAMFLLVNLFCLIVLLILSVSVSKDNLRIKRLAQEIALLRDELRASSAKRRSVQPR